MRAISSAVSETSPAAQLAVTRSGCADFGIANTSGLRQRKASATACAATPRALATAASTWPPGLSADGKSPQPKGL